MHHPDLARLQRVLLDQARRALDVPGEFCPFGGTVEQDGSVALITGYTIADAPNLFELIELIEARVRGEAAAQSIRAAGVCLNVHAGSWESMEIFDAILLRLQHASGEGFDAFVPYRKTLLGGLTYGTPRLQSGTLQVFAPVAVT